MTARWRGFDTQEVFGIYNRALTESEILDVAIADGGGRGAPGTVSTNLDIHLPSSMYESPFGTIDIWADMKFYGQGPNAEILWQLTDFGEN